MTSQQHNTDLLPLDEARRAAAQTVAHRRVRPLHAGRLVFPDFDVNDVTPYVDWNRFLAEWDTDTTPHDQLRDEALQLLHHINDLRLLRLQAVVGIYPARSEGDNIVVTDPKGRTTTLPLLRNQTRGQANRSLADYLSPEDDYIGAYAATAGLGLDTLCAQYDKEGDTRTSKLAAALARALTQAFAEALHTFVRREMWGYEADTKTSPDEVLAGHYRGLRVETGTPMLPDTTLRRDLFSLLAVTLTTEMQLDAQGGFQPRESLCGLLLADGEPFSLGHIDRDQLLDYAARRHTDPVSLWESIADKL